MAKRLVWVSNTFKNPNYATPMIGQSHLEAVKTLIEWETQFIKGEPQSTQTCSVYEMKNLGYIGLYKEVEDDAKS
jgi:hypothetical protein